MRTNENRSRTWSALGVSLALLALAGATGAQQTRPGSGTSDVTVDNAPLQIDFGVLRSDQIGSVRTFKITNHSSSILFLRGAEVVGPDAGAFRLLQAPGYSTGVFGTRPGIVPGKTRRLSVVFEPDRRGLFQAEILIEASRPLPFGSDRITLRGVGLGPLGDELRVNAGGFGAVDSGGREWARDYGWKAGRRLAVPGFVANTTDEALYQDQRTGVAFSYAFELPRPGAYTVVVHFAELEHVVDGARVFSVYADGQRMIADLDVHAAAGAAAAYLQTFTGRAQDTVLDLDFVASVGEAAVAAIEVYSMPLLEASPSAVSFGALAQGEAAQQVLQITSSGSQGTVLESLALRLGASGTPVAFLVELDGNSYAGGTQDVVFDLDLPLPPGAALPLTITFQPTEEQYDVVSLELEHTNGLLEVELSGLGGHEGDPFLHVVIEGETLLVDRDADGVETLVLVGTSSHTHEPGRSITTYRWSADGAPVGLDPVLSTALGQGLHTVALEIEDDNVPSHALTLETQVHVVGTGEIPGVLALYYPASPGGAAGCSWRRR